MDYAPDFPIRTPGLLYDVNSFVPDVSGNYQTAPLPRTLALDITSGGSTVNVFVGAACLRINETNNRTFLGSRTKLFTDDGADLSPATTFSMITDGAWTFTAFNDRVIAANGVDPLRQRALDTSTDAFTAIGGAPRALIVLQHENAVLALGGATNSQGWYCSDTGDYTQWSAAPNNNADSGVLYGGIGGPLTAGATWDKYAIAFKANAMYAGVRVEEIDQAIRWTTINDQVGCVAPYAWTKTELGLVFISERDVLIYDGGKPLSIADKIRRKFFSTARFNIRRTFVTHDELERNIYFWCSSADGDVRWPTMAFVYNYRSGKWGKLPTIQTLGTAYVAARCPVAGSGLANNSLGAPVSFDDGTGPLEGQANLVVMYDADRAYLTNVCHRAIGGSGMTRHSTGKPSITTGYVGAPDMDSTLSRVLVVPETLGVDPESGIITTIREDASTTQQAAGISPTGMIDRVTVGRYFQANVTWPATIEKQTIAAMQPVFAPTGPKKGR